jgi:hypothetical protein
MAKVHKGRVNFWPWAQKYHPGRLSRKMMEMRTQLSEVEQKHRKSLIIGLRVMCIVQ